MIQLARIATGRNARTVAVLPEHDAGLRRSIAAAGVLQPVVLRCPAVPSDALAAPGEAPLELVLGNRRFAAAQALGLTEIPADVRVMTDAEVAAAQVAENTQREAMHPVDQWRQMRALIQDHGLTFEQAAGALGLDERLTRRMEQLGRLNPTLLKLAEIEMPTAAQLRKIAAAPAKLQIAAAAIKGLVIMRGAAENVDWHRVVSACERRRISRAVAIFDTKTRKLPWDEDLFAEPGADDQFTTADVDNFMKHQTKALQAQVADLVKAGKRHQVAELKTNSAIGFPSGFKASFGTPGRLRLHEWAFHAVMPDGTIRIETAIDTKAIKKAEKSAPAQTQQGTTAEAKGAAHDGDDDGDDDGENDEADPAPPAPEAPRPFNRRGMMLIAAAKGAALRKTLNEATLPPGRVIALLILALSADNVDVRGLSDGHFADLATRLLAPGGQLLEVSDADLCAMGQTALGRMLHVGTPEAGRTASGWAAEWIGAAIGAGASLDRFDSQDFLTTASLTELKRAAADAALLPTGTAANLRERLTGRVPDYRPEPAAFGAPAPTLRKEPTPQKAAV